MVTLEMFLLYDWFKDRERVAMRDNPAQLSVARRLQRGKCWRGCTCWPGDKMAGTLWKYVGVHSTSIWPCPTYTTYEVPGKWKKTVQTKYFIQYLKKLHIMNNKYNFKYCHILTYYLIMIRQKSGWLNKLRIFRGVVGARLLLLYYRVTANHPHKNSLYGVATL